MLNFTGLVVAASLMLGQAQDIPSAHEHLKALDSWVGTWVYDGAMLEDWPGVAKKGDAVTARFTYRWILNRSVIESVGKITVKDGSVLESKGLTGWDPAKKQIVVGSMASGGGYSLGVMTVSEDGKTFTTENQGIEMDGKETSGTAVATVEGDTLTFQAKDRKGSDLPPDSPKYTFKREVKPAKQKAK